MNPTASPAEVSSAFVAPVPRPLPPSAPATRQKTGPSAPSAARRASSVRRPRPALRSAWPGSSEARPAATCTCRVTPRCSAGDEAPDDADAGEAKPDAWLTELRTWLRAPGRDAASDTAPPDDEALLQEAQPPDEPDPHEGRPEGRARTRPEFRWPWQKEANATGEGKENEERGDGKPPVVRAAEKVSHSDSKPAGSFTRNAGATADGGSKMGKSISWQERWEKIVRVIAPNINRKDPQTDVFEDVPDSKPANPTTGNGTHGKQDESDSTVVPRSSSVSELYSPPSDASDGSTDKRSSSGQSQKPVWPKIPWGRAQSGRESEGEENAAIVAERKRSAGPRISRVPTTETGKDESVSTLPGRKGAAPVGAERRAEAKMREETDVVEGQQAKDDERNAQDSEAQEANQREQEPALHLPSVRVSQLKISAMDIASIPQRDVAAIRLIFGSETFFATETLSPPGGLIFRGNLRGEPIATLAKLEERLAARLGDKYTLCLAEGEEDLRPVVVVVPTARDKRPATPRQRFIAVVIALFTITTCLTRGLYAAIYRPLIQAFYPMTGTSVIEKTFALPTTIALITSGAIGFVILMSQIVQRIVASRHGTRIALPYFIPSVQLGSFGAVVQLASPTPTRAALFDIALSGAATLVALSLGCLLVGLRLSTTFPAVVPVPISTVSSSVVIGFLTQQVPNGQILIDYGRSLIGLHPLAVIGANCLTIAALNLLPIRQLDGGRIISALYGRRTAVLASRVTVMFLLLASTKSPYFVVFLAAVTFGPWNLDRPAKNELTEPNGFRTIVGYIFMLLMIGVLLPFPASKFFGTM